MGRFKKPLPGLSRLSDRIGGSRGEVEFIASTSATGNGTYSVSKPSGTVDDDTLVMLIARNTGNSAPATPSGWNLLTQSVDSSPVPLLSGFYKTASSEPSSYSVPTGGGSAVVISTFRGVYNITSFANENANPASTTLSIGPHVPLAGGVMLFAAVGDYSRGVDVAPSGMTHMHTTDRFGDNLAVYRQAVVADESSTKSITWNYSVKSYGAMFTVTN